MGPSTDRLIASPKGWQPDWLTSEFSLALIDALGSDNMCFVGGAVRDSLLGISATDVDIATPHTPEAVQRLLGKASIKTIPTGLQHGTITAVYGGATCEITTLRRDVATDGRRAVVEFTDSWQADALRRDFTINALYVTSNGMIYDPVKGLDDLRDKVVRFIGDAEKRIEEDALRILRFYRFTGLFASQIDENGHVACRKCREMLDGLSVERTRDELLKILRLTNLASSITHMKEAGILNRIYGDGWLSAPIEVYCINETRLKAPIDPLVRLYVLSSDLLSAVEIAEKFKLSNLDRRFLLTLERACQHSHLETEKDIRRSLYIYGKPATLAAAIVRSNTIYDTVSQVSHDWPIPEFPLKGRDLIALGATAGPELGETLTRLEENWIESDFSLTKDQLLATL